ncbi:MAG: hypothetical protein QM594_19430 [Niabella sp.]
MFPNEKVYPKFVPDQLLTSDDLNFLFGYLDEQGRLTRTNLLGIGIVCGLKVTASADGSSVTISKGCGVTSEGYLINFEETTFTGFISYNALRPRYYDGFFTSGTGTRTQDMALWELKQTATDPDATNLSKSFLADKLVLLFAELLEEQNKNCNVDSCDDKGGRVMVTIRPLLVDKASLDKFNKSAQCLPAKNFQELPGLSMPRWNVPNTSPVTTADIIDAYLDVLSPTFINQVKAALAGLYNIIKSQPCIADGFSTDPFNSIATDFAFLHNGNITDNQAIHIQYYYDFFSDLVQAYKELCAKGSALLCINCVPDAGLFPRHLLLGILFPSEEIPSKPVRHHFVYSPLFDQRHSIGEITALFRRLVSIYTNRVIPAPVIAQNEGIGITPSILGKEALSKKAIPYYYKINNGTDALYKLWSPVKTSQGKAATILSYNAASYTPPVSDAVLNPLKYDIEPYNFLRVEGHIGKNYKTVLQNILSQKEQNRLPFDVIVLRTGNPQLDNLEDAVKECYIKDLETSYAIVKREWEAIIGQTIEFLDDNMNDARRLLQEYMVGSDIIGNYMRDLHAGKTYMDVHIALSQFIETYNSFIVLFERIERESTMLRGYLVEVIANQRFNENDRNKAEDLMDHFDEVALSCKKGSFRAIYQEFVRRSEELYRNVFFGNYAAKNPGLQHKAGVPVGGTLVLVYHHQQSVKMVKGPFTITGRVVSPDKKTGVRLAQVSANDNDDPVYTNATGLFELRVDALPAMIEAFIYDKKQGAFSGNIIVTEKNFRNITLVLGSDAAGTPKREQVIIGRENIFDIITGRDAASKALSYNEALPDGTIIADFYLPYICCSDCAPVVYQFPEPQVPLSVTASDPQCDEDGNNFSVTLTINGGKAPYKVEGKEIDGNEVEVRVKSGSGSKIDISDSGHQAVSFTIDSHECMKPLSVTGSEPVCDESGESFSTTITISGGVTPYSVDGNQIEGNSTTLKTPSGSGQNIVVKDGAGNETAFVIQSHQCPGPCDLPCEGKAEKCNYILWMQKPAEGNSLKQRTEKAVIQLFAESSSEDIDVTDIFQSVFDNNEISFASFDELFIRLCLELSSKIPAHFSANGEPLFTYDKEIQSLAIEKFVCHDIRMEIQLTLSSDYNLNVQYDKEGVRIDYGGENSMAVPKFGCISIDKCKNISEALCKEPLAVESVKGVRTGRTNITFEVNPEFNSYYWYFREGRPAWSADKNPVIFHDPQQKPYVHFMGMGANGCFAIFTGEVEITEMG